MLARSAPQQMLPLAVREYVASKQLTRPPLSRKHVGFLILYEGHATVDKNTMSRLNFNRRQMRAGTDGRSTAACVYHRFTARSAPELSFIPAAHRDTCVLTEYTEACCLGNPRFPMAQL